MNTPLKPLPLVFGILFGMSIIALFTGVKVVHAAAYYVATNGSDSNSGTQSSPFATLGRAHTAVSAGDTIYMRGGTYMLTGQVVLTKDGTSGNRINLFNYPGEAPIIDGINMTTSYHEGIVLRGASWWHIKGLEIKNAPAIGLVLKGGSSNNIIEFCVFHHNIRLDGSGAGLQLDASAGGNNLILNNDSHHNAANQSSGTGGDGFGDSTRATGNVFWGNRAWRNHDDGFDLSGATGILLERNWAWENGLDNSLQKTSGNGAGFKLGLNLAQDGDHILSNNLAWQNAEDGFNDNGAGTPMTLYNNTGWKNNRLGMFNFNFWSAVANVLWNNLSENPDTAPMNAAVIHDHNSWNGGVTVTTADFVSTDFTANTGARKSDGSLPDSNFLKLTSTSDLIDKGVNVGLPYSGTAPPLGAYDLPFGQIWR